MPANIIQNQIDIIRQEGYAMLRTPSLARERLEDLTAILETSIMDTFYIKEGSHIAGISLKELDLRKRSGATILAVIRGGSARTNPPSDFVLAPGDILVILGSHAQLNTAMEILKGVEAKKGKE